MPHSPRRRGAPAPVRALRSPSSDAVSPISRVLVGSALHGEAFRSRQNLATVMFANRERARVLAQAAAPASALAPALASAPAPARQAARAGAFQPYRSPGKNVASSSLSTPSRTAASCRKRAAAADVENSHPNAIPASLAGRAGKQASKRSKRSLAVMAHANSCDVNDMPLRPADKQAFRGDKLQQRGNVLPGPGLSGPSPLL